MLKKFHRTLATTLTVMSMIPAFPAHGAGTEVEEMQAIEVKAARSSITQKNSPASLSIITREQIRKKQYTQVEDVLRDELGLDVVQTGPMGSSTSVFTRGAGSSSTLVMVDGIQVNLNTTGGFNFANLTTDNIERIEILRGPQSTLWGADAVGGVINIITRRGKGKPSLFFSFEGGSFATFKETAGSTGAVGDLDYSLTVSRTDSEGFSSASDDRGNSENDGYRNTSIATRTGYNFLGDGRVEFIGHFIASHIEFDNFSFTTGLPVDGPPYSNGKTFYIAAPLKKSLTPWWDIKLNPSVAYDELKSRNQTFPDSNILNRTYTVNLQNNLDLGDYFSVVLGGEYQLLNGRNVGSGINKNIINHGYYLTNTFNYQDALVITAGFRHDVNLSFKDKTTYKFEGGYRFKKLGTRIRTAYATGFRAPTVNDLFFPLFGNPDLVPEESKNWEVGIDQSLFQNRVRISFTYFDTDFDNLIQFDSGTFRPENIGKASSRGTETTLNLDLPWNAGLKVNHTFNKTRDDATGAQLRRRAEQKFSANITHTWRKKLNSLVGLIYKSGINDGARRTKDYYLLRAALSYQIMKNIKLTVRGENLLDDNYEEVPGFGTAGISGFAGLAFNFN